MAAAAQPQSVRQLAGKGDRPCGSSTEPGYLSRGFSVSGTSFPSGSRLDRLSPGMRRSTRYSRCCLVLERNVLRLDAQLPNKRLKLVSAIMKTAAEARALGGLKC